MNWFRFKACLKCGGDLVLDDGDWLSLQCATYYYIGLANDGNRLELPPPPIPAKYWHQQKSFGLSFGPSLEPSLKDINAPYLEPSLPFIVFGWPVVSQWSTAVLL